MLKLFKDDMIYRQVTGKMGRVDSVRAWSKRKEYWLLPGIEYWYEGEQLVTRILLAESDLPKTGFATKEEVDENLPQATENYRRTVVEEQLSLYNFRKIRMFMPYSKRILDYVNKNDTFETVWRRWEANEKIKGEVTA